MYRRTVYGRIDRTTDKGAEHLHCGCTTPCNFYVPCKGCTEYALVDPAELAKLEANYAKVVEDNAQLRKQASDILHRVWIAMEHECNECANCVYAVDPDEPMCCSSPDDCEIALLRQALEPFLSQQSFLTNTTEAEAPAKAEPEAATVSELEAIIAEKDEALREVLAECAVEDDDERLKYVEVQMHRDVLEGGRGALALTPKSAKAKETAEHARIGRAVEEWLWERKAPDGGSVTWRCGYFMALADMKLLITKAREGKDPCF